jgi:uncharacterized membrane protein
MILSKNEPTNSILHRLFTVLLRYQKIGLWLIMLAAYAYLAFQLYHYKHYPELLEQWRHTPLSQFGWLVSVFVLLPLNWSLEAIKWQKLVAKFQLITFKIALKSVFAGIYTGFFTPNRVSEMLGRVLFLKSENRKAGAVLSVINSLTQNIIMTLCGIPACFYFFSVSQYPEHSAIFDYLIGLSFLLLLFILLFFIFPTLSRQLTSHPWFTKLRKYTASLSQFSPSDLSIILFISLFRYLVFCIQFYCMLRFFGVELEPLQALIAIPANYLFVTYTPAIAFSEAAVRSAYALFFIGAFSTQVLGIALAGVCIWVVNFCIPLMIGSILISLSPHAKSSHSQPSSPH